MCMVLLVTIMMHGDNGVLGPYTKELEAKQERLAWLCYFLLGAGLLAPWNAFLTATDYFESMYPGRHMDRLFTVCYLPMCLFMLGLMIKYPRIATLRVRILVSFVGFSLIMMFVPLMDAALVMGHSQGSAMTLGLVLSCVVLTGFFDGLSQGAVFADAALLPAQYTQAVVGGTASSGVLICLMRIITKAAMANTTDSLRKSTALYFSLAGALSMLCVGVYGVFIPKLTILQRYRGKEEDGGTLLQLAHLHPGGTVVPPATAQVDESTSFLKDHQHSLHDDMITEAILSDEAEIGVKVDSGVVSRPAIARLSKHRSLQDQRIVNCFQRIWQLSVAMFTIYVVTLSIFPGFLAEDVHSATLGDWYPIILITIYNIADLVGKLLPVDVFIRSKDHMMAASVVRILFIPAFILADSYNAHAVVMGFLTMKLGLSNGYLTAQCMAMAPDHTAAADAGLAENILVFSLVVGLNIGAYCGWLWLL